MTRGAHPTQSHEGQPLPPEFTFPLQYAIPFDWGSFQVTEAAHKAYGLSPFTTTVSSRAELPVPSLLLVGAPGINILLVAPTEASADLVPNSVSVKATRTDKKEINVVIASAEDKTTLTSNVSEVVKHGLQAAIGVDDPDILKRIMNQDTIPLEQSLEQNVPQMLVQVIVGGIQQELKNTLVRVQRAEGNQSTLRRITILGSTSICAAFGTAAAESALFPSFRAENILLAGAMLVFFLKRGRRELKDWFAKANEREAYYDQLGQSYADKVAADIHASYDRAQFDRRFEES